MVTATGIITDFGVNIGGTIMAVYPYTYVDKRGVPVIASTGVTVTTTEVSFSFPNHAFVNTPYRGTVIIKLAQAIPAGTTTTLPIVFTTNGVNKNLTNVGGANITVAELTTNNVGYYQVYYDKQENVLQLMTAIIQ